MNVSLKLDPRKKLATWEQIKAKRDELEASPIQLFNGNVYDYNERTELRLQKALKGFDSLRSVQENGGMLPWKLSNNEWYLHTKEEFQQVVNDIDLEIAKRSDELFARAEQLAANPPTVEDLELLSTWFI